MERELHPIVQIAFKTLSRDAHGAMIVGVNGQRVLENELEQLKASPELAAALQGLMELALLLEKKQEKAAAATLRAIALGGRKLLAAQKMGRRVREEINAGTVQEKFRRMAGLEREKKILPPPVPVWPGGFLVRDILTAKPLSAR
jgi:hypothetical protein